MRSCDVMPPECELPDLCDLNVETGSVGIESGFGHTELYLGGVTPGVDWTILLNLGALLPCLNVCHWFSRGENFRAKSGTTAETA